MRRLLLLSVLLTLALLVTGTVAQDTSVRHERASAVGAATPISAPTASAAALLIAIPLPGHVNPLLAQGLELVRRGWRVTIASPTRMREHVLAFTAALPDSSMPLAYMDLGECAAIGTLREHLRRAADSEDYMASSAEMLHWALACYECMYTALAEAIPKLAHRPDLIVSDFATYAGFDIADTFDIPYVVNNADLLNMHSPDDVEPYDFIPGTMTAASIATVNGVDSWYGLAPRCLYPLVRPLLRAIGEMTAGRVLREARERVGFTLPEGVDDGLFSRLRGRLLLVNNAFGGVEYARPLAPNVVLVGPMLERPWRTDLTKARAEYRAQLSSEDATWLEASSDVPVVWVSMGTIAPLNERQILAMYTAFAADVHAGTYRVLWKLPQEDQALLPSVDARPPSSQLRLTTWVSSQLGVLAHPSTRVFLSHCGINSAHEAVYLGVRLLCIPILADQADMAARVLDAGVGQRLAKTTFDAHAITDALSELLDPHANTRYESNLHRARATMHLAGGVARAVDYLEYVAAHGAEAFVPVHARHPWYVRAQIDVLIVYAFVAFLVYRLLRCCCCTHRPGRGCASARRKNTKARLQRGDGRVADVKDEDEATSAREKRE